MRGREWRGLRRASKGIANLPRAERFRSPFLRVLASPACSRSGLRQRSQTTISGKDRSAEGIGEEDEAPTEFMPPKESLSKGKVWPVTMPEGEAVVEERERT